MISNVTAVPPQDLTSNRLRGSARPIKDDWRNMVQFALVPKQYEK